MHKYKNNILSALYLTLEAAIWSAEIDTRKPQGVCFLLFEQMKRVCGRQKKPVSVPEREPKPKEAETQTCGSYRDWWELPGGA